MVNPAALRPGPQTSVSTQTPAWQTGVAVETQTAVPPTCRTRSVATQTDKPAVDVVAATQQAAVAK